MEAPVSDLSLTLTLAVGLLKLSGGDPTYFSQAMLAYHLDLAMDREVMWSSGRQVASERIQRLRGAYCGWCARADVFLNDSGFFEEVNLRRQI